MLRQHVERTGAERRRVLRMIGDRPDRGVALQHLEAVGRNENAARRLVEPVVGAADALQQTRRALRCADIDDQIDVAPVDAEIERRGAHDRAQPARGHGVLHLAALRHIERAMMQRDGKVVVVDVPERVKDHLGLAARVDEDQRHLVLLDQLVDLRKRVARRMAGPGQILAGLQHGDVRLGAAVGHDEIGMARAMLRLRHQEPAEVVGLGHCGRETGHAETRRKLPKTRQAEREQIAALGSHQRVQLVEHDAPETAEQVGRIGACQQQCELFGRGQQNVGRIAALALALRGRRIAGAGLDADRETHFADRRFEVAGDIDRKRLQR